MDQTLRQLGGLLLGAVPTVILLAILSGLYTFLVHRPLMRVLAQRRERTEGAMEKARADIAAAEARTADYEQSLREARQRVFKAQELRRQQALQARSEAVTQARLHAQRQVKEARETMEQDTREALSRLETEARRLASEIVRTVLQPIAAPSQAGGR